MTIVLMSDPSVAAIPVEECGEPLVDVRQCGELLADTRRSDPAGAFAHLRKGVRDRLLDAQRRPPDGLRLLIVEGYRPPDLQQTYFERYSAQLRAANPDWTQQDVRVAASRSVSPPEIAPHSAGSAVDLTLVDRTGKELDMGTAMNANPEESENACYTGAANISASARANRTTLSIALSEAGLINYVTEWWHWSHGDRYWALRANRPAALYGPAEMP